MLDSIKPKDFIGFSDFDAPDGDVIDTCIHCGLCLNECPTYRVLRVEMDSPRGRIQLINAVNEGHLSLNDESFQKHMFLCLDCHGCESACPSGVEYGSILEAARAQANRVGSEPRGIKIANRIMKHLFGNPWLLRATAKILRAYQRSGFRDLLLDMLPERLQLMEGLTPRISSHFIHPKTMSHVPALGKPRYTVGFLSGCIMSVAFAHVHEASLRVLARNGCEVHLPKDQVCCGALNYHNGDRATARDWAKRNLVAFDDPKYDAIVVNSAGCGSTMKSWADLLEQDPEFSEIADRISNKVYDFSEWLAHIGIQPPPHKIHARVAYQDACHLRHAQGITAQPRDLISTVAGTTIVGLNQPHLCCGSAGVYSAINTDLSIQILDEKLDSIESSHATHVITTNPGCQSHIAAGLNRRNHDVKIVHIAEFLDAAYEGSDI